jgi:hypothetical protein
MTNPDKRRYRLAGGPDRLWPHVKTHKMEALVRMQARRGIRRFKCATIAEAEMCARAGGEHVLLAYPLVGPNIARFLSLGQRYGETLFYALGDDREQLALLGRAARALGREIPVLIDLNLGMNRTGVAPEELESFCLDCAALRPPAHGLPRLRRAFLDPPPGGKPAIFPPAPASSRIEATLPNTRIWTSSPARPSSAAW